MGRVFADGLNEVDMSLADQLRIHLTANHYPPVPTTMILACIKAIDAGNEGEWDRQIELPEGVSWRGNRTASASAIIEAHHLDTWLNSDDE